MKLQNKKTDVVVDVEIREVLYDNIAKLELVDKTTGSIIAMYNSLAGLNAEWKDYEKPKGIQGVMTQDEDIIIRMGSIEEANRAVEKLKALQRLIDNGFRFTGWRRNAPYYGDFTISAEDQTSCDDMDLDLLFGGEE